MTTKSRTRQTANLTGTFTSIVWSGQFLYQVKLISPLRSLTSIPIHQQKDKKSNHNTMRGIISMFLKPQINRIPLKIMTSYFSFTYRLILISLSNRASLSSSSLSRSVPNHLQCHRTRDSMNWKSHSTLAS